MTNPNKAELRRLAEASEQAFANLCEHGGDEAAEAWHAAEEAYSVASGSSVVLALLDESDEWERLFKSAGNATKNAISDRDQLRAQVEALRKDAERYRWLRTADWWVSPLCAIRDPKQNAKLGSDCPSRDRLDKAIDAAMSQEASHD